MKFRKHRLTTNSGVFKYNLFSIYECSYISDNGNIGKFVNTKPVFKSKFHKALRFFIEIGEEIF